MWGGPFKRNREGNMGISQAVRLSQGTAEVQKQEGAYGAGRLACVPKAARQTGRGRGYVWVEKGQIGKGPLGHTRIWPSILKKPLKNFPD